MSEQRSEWNELPTDIEAFWSEEHSETVQGKVSSITTMMLANRPTVVAILILTADCKGVTGKKKEQEVVKLSAGDAIGVVLKHKLQDLKRMVENQNEVNIKVKEKITLDNGNTLWRYSIKFKGKLSPLAPPQTRRGSSPEDEADEAFAAF